MFSGVEMTLGWGCGWGCGWHWAQGEGQESRVEMLRDANHHAEAGEALQALSAARTRVVRDGAEAIIAREDLVPGDD